jgi:hypothetical protein
MSTVTLIKADAMIDIKIGAGFLQKLQQVLTSMVDERSEEELQAFNQLNALDSADYPEPWMENLVTIFSLIKTIEEAAAVQGLTYDSPMDPVSPPES